MSLYGKYLSEMSDTHIIETDKGYATYSFELDSVYIKDIYVLPEFRRSRECFNMADKIASVARSKGINKMLGSVMPTYKGSTESLKMLLAYGFRLQSCTNNFILFEKDIS